MLPHNNDSVLVEKYFPETLVVVYPELLLSVVATTPGYIVSTNHILGIGKLEVQS